MRENFISRGNSHNLNILISSLSILFLLSILVFAGSQWLDETGDGISVSLNLMDNYESNSSTINFTFTPIIINSTEDFTKATLWINISGIWQGNETNATSEFILTNNSLNWINTTLPDGVYSWNVNITDGTQWNMSTSNRTITVNGVRPELFIDTVHWNSSNTQNWAHPTTNDNITFIISINNTGTEAAENFNILFYWESTLINTTNVSTINSTLSAGGSLFINFTKNDTSSTGGERNVTFVIDPNNIITEYNETEENNTKKLEFAVGYNVSINISDGNGNLNPNITNPGNNIPITLTVTYTNGDPVTDLNETNFTIYDTYSGSNINTTNVNVNTSKDVSRNSEGIYIFNIPTWNDTNTTYPRIHNITVNILDKTYSGEYTSINYYNLTVPQLEITFEPSSPSQIAEGSYSDIKVFVNNTGLATIESVNISLSESDGDIDINESSSVTCNSNLTLTPSGSENICTIRINLLNDDDSDNDDGIVYASAKGIYNGITYYSSLTSVTQGIDDDDSSSSSSSGSSSSSSFNSGTGSATYTYELSIDSYPTSVEVEQGKEKDILVKVKNTGNKTLQDVKVKLKGVNWTHNWYSVSPSEKDNLLETDTQSFTITINTKSDSKVDSHTLTLTATATSADDKTKTFTLKVVPNQTTISTLNVSISELENNITSLKKDVDYLVKKANNTNITLISEKYEKLEKLLNETKTAISNNDYFTASQNEEEMKSILKEIVPLINSEKEKISGITGRVIGTISGSGAIVLTLVLIAVLAYVLSPLYISKIFARAPATTGGYSHQEGFKFVSKKSEEESISRKIRRFIEKLLEKLKGKKEQQTKIIYNFHRKNRWG